MNDWLHASFDTSDVISHWVKASLGRVDFDDLLELCLASGKLVLPSFALGLAVLEHQWLGVFSGLDH